MYLALRKAAIRLCLPVWWSASTRRMSESLNKFSLIEADSAWQMLQALNAIDDLELRSELFNNALEEVHHAWLFRNLAKRIDRYPPGLSARSRLPLYDQSSGIDQFEAFHFVGEADVYEQFLTYANAAPTEEVRRTFLDIRGDEEEHQKLAFKNLVAMAGSEDQAQRMISRIRIKRFVEQCGRLLESTGSIIAAFPLGVFYLIFAPCLFGVCQRQLHSAWHTVDDSVSPEGLVRGAHASVASA